jgi:MATE family multidrug resistance protein
MNFFKDLKSLFRPTSYQFGSLREVISLSLPIMLTLFSGSMMGFVEGVFLAKHSLSAMESVGSATYLCRLFQLPCMSIALFAQIFIATYMGSKQYDKVGRCIWQMIWFSGLSMLITLPLSFAIAPIFFSGTSVVVTGSQYFHILAFCNFLYPLGIVLSSFYLGQGKSKIVVLTTFSAHCFHAFIAYLLIFGWDGIIPALGAKGAAIASGLSQALFCTILFLIILKKTYRYGFNLQSWQLDPLRLWEYVRVGLPRALGRIIMLGVGTATIRIITAKGGDYLFVLTIGARIVFFLSFIGDGLHQAMLTLVSHFIGSKETCLKWRLLKSGYIFMFIIGVVLTIPLIVFPESFLYWFFSEPLTPYMHHLLRLTLCWIWFQTLAYISQAILVGFVLAMKDTFFYLRVGCFTWLTSFLPLYLAIDIWEWPPDTMWAIMGIEGVIFSIVYYLRLKQIRNREISAICRSQNG